MGRRRLWIACIGSALLIGVAPGAHAQGRPTSVSATRANSADLRAWDSQIDLMLRNRDLRVRELRSDDLVADRRHQRLDQYFHFVRIAGGDLTRQLGADGTVSIFGTLHTGLDLSTTPVVTAEAARFAIGRAVNGQPRGGDAELVILPLPDGYHLAYAGQAVTDNEVLNVFVDANSGALLRQYSDFLSDVGTGKGTYGDTKKISTTIVAGTFMADDKLRPAAITTYDMKGNLGRAVATLVGATPLVTGDVASSSDNTKWTDPAVVDAHVYAGWYYDYLYKRFGRRGLDGQNLRMPVFTHPVRLSDIATASPSTVGMYYLNAFYCPTCGADSRGAVMFGEGAPTGYLGPGIEVKPFSASLDVVAHELTHGVTANTSGLNGRVEPDAINEGFSDIFGVSAAFFFEPAGSGALQASYLEGKELTVPPGLFSRSLSNPAQTGNPDHYSLRDIEPHFTSTILSHAFYLAVEGGTNRTSGLGVQGVGAANRDQIEKVFFRALTLLIPSRANFGLTRAATIQAARDLYPAAANVEAAVTQAWNAVGVQERTVPTAAVVGFPVSAATCPGPQPSWGMDVIVSAGTSSLSITQWQLDAFDTAGGLVSTTKLTASDFSRLFNVCGAASTRVLAQSDACTAVCANLGGRSGGAIQFTFTAADDANRPLTFGTGRATLSR